MSKAVNYTDAQTGELVTAYQAAQDEEQREAVISFFSEEFGKNTKSVRAKLVREGVYVKKAYKTKAGNAPERKSAIVADIANALGVATEVVESLEKATKPTLNLIRGTLSRLPQE